MKDIDIKSGLVASGVAEVAFGTTLPKEGRDDLRACIVNKAYQRPNGMFGFFLYTNKASSVTKARRIFYTLAKELFLSGVPVYCISLSKLIEAMETEGYSRHGTAMDNVKMVFVIDFYEDGAPSPIQANTAGVIRSWVKDRFERGLSVSFMTDTPLKQCAKWWPNSFLDFLSENTISIQVQ